MLFAAVITGFLILNFNNDVSKLYNTNMANFMF